MFKSIRELLKNRNQAKIQEENGVTVYPTEEILGSIKAVKDFAAFYVKHRAELEVIKANSLLDYCENMQFDKEMMLAYKMGVDSVMKFFEASELDTQSYLLQAESKNKETV